MRFSQYGCFTLLGQCIQCCVQAKIQGAENVQPSWQRYARRRTVRVGDGRRIAPTGLDLYLIGSPVAAIQWRPDAANSGPPDGTPLQAQFAQFRDRKLDDLDVYHHHLFETETIGEIDDLRIAARQQIDATQVAVRKAVPLHNYLVSNDRRLGLWNGGEERRNLSRKATGVPGNDIDLEALVATIFIPDKETGRSHGIRKENHFFIVKCSRCQNRAIAHGDSPHPRCWKHS